MRYFLGRRRPFWISIINLIGLAFSVSGVLLLFWYALPNEIPNAPNVIVADRDQEEVKAEELQTTLYHYYTKLGLGLVLVGAILEAVPPACTAWGSRRGRRVTPVTAPTSCAGSTTSEPERAAPLPPLRDHEPPGKGR